MVWGGWDGHEPQQCTEFFANLLEEQGYDVTIREGVEAYEDKDLLMSQNLISNNVTMGSLSNIQTNNLLEAVESGIGFAGWHGGMCDAFRDNMNYHFLTGGQFLSHPGNIREYEVKIVNNRDPILVGLSDFKFESEQYYMLTDPRNEVLATSTFDDQSIYWIKGTEMPTVWKRMHGEGKVFYSALGHVLQDFNVYEVKEIMLRGLLWATQKIS